MAWGHNCSSYIGIVEANWNVMAHAQKPHFVFQRNGRVHLNRRGCQFSRLLAAEVCASAVVMLDTPCSKVVWRVLATHCIRQFPVHFPSRASPCTITVQLESIILFKKHTDLKAVVIHNDIQDGQNWNMWRVWCDHIRCRYIVLLQCCHLVLPCCVLCLTVCTSSELTSRRTNCSNYKNCSLEQTRTAQGTRSLLTSIVNVATGVWLSHSQQYII